MIENLAHLDAIVGQIEYPLREFRAGLMGDGYFVQVTYEEPDVMTGVVEPQHGRKWYVSKHATESEVIQTCLKAALTSAEHQVREHFLVDGVAPFAPHFDVEDLVRLAREHGMAGARTPAPRFPEA